MMTFKELMDRIVQLPIPDDALVRINGEYVDDLRLMLQTPAKETTEHGVVWRERDHSRSKVLDILANGREPEPLPIITLDVSP